MCSQVENCRAAACGPAGRARGAPVPLSPRTTRRGVTDARFTGRYRVSAECSPLPALPLTSFGLTSRAFPCSFSSPLSPFAGADCAPARFRSDSVVDLFPSFECCVFIKSRPSYLSCCNSIRIPGVRHAMCSAPPIGRTLASAKFIPRRCRGELRLSSPRRADPAPAARCSCAARHPVADPCLTAWGDSSHPGSHSILVPQDAWYGETAARSVRQRTQARSA